MRTNLPFANSLCAALCGLLINVTAPAATLHVWQGSPNPTPPYTNWSTAAATIQDAVDMATAGDEIVVTNGVYQTGARVVGGMSNRVAVTQPVTVRSVGGAAVTQIVGYQVPGTTNGPAAVRCVYLTNGAMLVGFTLTNGATQTAGSSYTNQSGGGVWCEGPSTVVSDCVFTGNSAWYYGGGAFSGTLKYCTLTGNSAYQGGGAYQCLLTNCTLTGNSASYGGGTSSGTLNNCTLARNSAVSAGGASGGTLNNCLLMGNSAYVDGGGASGGTLNNCTVTGNFANRGGGTSAGTLKNCIVYYNIARLDGANCRYGTLNYCCTTPLPAGTGNLVDEPQLASMSHLSAGSPCIGRGSAAYASGLDLDGEPWANLPSIGCDEYWNGSVTGALSVAVVAAYTNVSSGFGVDFQAVIGGRVSASRWDFGDGVAVSNRPCISHAWATAGEYVVELRAYNASYPDGVAATVMVHVVQEEHYVALTSANPVPPYNSWATAARNIQDAVDAATQPGALVWVSDGVYQTGARAVYGMSNRVAVTKPVAVRSVNGPAVTQIMGQQQPGTTNGPVAVRCVYLTNGAMLAGFTLTNGATQTSGNDYTNQSGGGVWCEGPSTVVSNCVFTGNSAWYYGGGAFSGTLNNCMFTCNSAAEGGGAHSATLNNSTLTGNLARYEGGGSYSGTLNYCTLTRNSSASEGGGTSLSTLNCCTVTSNVAYYGGGAYYGTLSHSSLTGNSAAYGGGTFGAVLNNSTLMGNTADYGGGASGGTLNNCTILGNTALSGGGTCYGTLTNCTLSWNSADYGGGDSGSTLNNCLLTGNSAINGGGGVTGGRLNNCTLTGNSADWGGGAHSSILMNCILYYNTAVTGSNYDGAEGVGVVLHSCCTTPLPDVGNGTSNITAEPLFVDRQNGNLRLKSNSPCIRSGNAYATGATDLDGRPRIVGGAVDMGAYEYQGPGMGEFIGWLQQYGLPTDGSADTADPDGDAHNNWQEWRCGTDPTNAASVLRLLAPVFQGNQVSVSWPSVPGLTYFLERSTDLSASPPFQPLATNLVGQAGVTTYLDTNAPGLPPRFYRVGVAY